MVTFFDEAARWGISIVADQEAIAGELPALEGEVEEAWI